MAQLSVNVQEISDLIEELNKKERKQFLDFVLPAYTGQIPVHLACGTIYVDVSSLDYTTLESFKAWCMQHAITNSEPVFNL